MKKALLFALIVVAIIIYLIVKPGEKAHTVTTHNLLLQQVEDLGKLELVRYNIQDIVEYKKLRNWLPNSKTILIVSGEVISCVDLTLMTAEDISVVNDSVSLVLPVPEICHVKIDHSRSKVYDVQFGLWDTPDLVDEAYRLAEEQIHKQALDMGLASQSRDSAIKLITPIMHALGFKKVSIRFQPSAIGEQGNNYHLPFR